MTSFISTASNGITQTARELLGAARRHPIQAAIGAVFLANVILENSIRIYNEPNLSTSSRLGQMLILPAVLAGALSGIVACMAIDTLRPAAPAPLPPMGPAAQVYRTSHLRRRETDMCNHRGSI